jgi:hypothetical protein
MIQDYLIDIPVAGQRVTVQLAQPANFYRVTRALGTVTLKLDQAADIRRVVGERGTRLSERITKIEVTSTVAETLTLSLGDDGDQEEGQGPAGVLAVLTQPNVVGVVETAHSTLAAGAVADISINVASAALIHSVEVSLGALAPAAVIYSLDANPASATQGTWLHPGEKQVCFFTTRTIVGFRAISFFNPNPGPVLISTRTYTR